MSKEWNPDSWILFKVKNHETPHYRLLCGWAEGTAKTEWKISGGILKHEESEDGLSRIFTTTKSTYVCEKSSYVIENHIYHVWQSLQDDPSKDVEKLKDSDLDFDNVEWLKI